MLLVNSPPTRLLSVAGHKEKTGAWRSSRVTFEDLDGHKISRKMLVEDAEASSSSEQGRVLHNHGHHPLVSAVSVDDVEIRHGVFLSYCVFRLSFETTDRRRMLCYRRFKDFVGLHSVIKDKLPPEDLARIERVFPHKGRLYKRFDMRFNRWRQAMMHDYMQSVLSVSNLMATIVLTQFLKGGDEWRLGPCLVAATARGSPPLGRHVRRPLSVTKWGHHNISHCRVRELRREPDALRPAVNRGTPRGDALTIPRIKAHDEVERARQDFDRLCYWNGEVEAFPVILSNRKRVVQHHSALSNTHAPPGRKGSARAGDAETVPTEASAPTAYRTHRQYLQDYAKRRFV